MKRKREGRRPWAARAIALLWALCWTGIGVLRGFGDLLAPQAVEIYSALPGFLFCLSAALAWRRECAGGLLLAAEGGMIALVYFSCAYGRLPLETIAVVLLTLAMPPLIAGVLFLQARR